MIGRRLPASSSFVLARACRRGAAGAPAWLRPRDGTNRQRPELAHDSAVAAGADFWAADSQFTGA